MPSTAVVLLVEDDQSTVHLVEEMVAGQDEIWSPFRFDVVHAVDCAGAERLMESGQFDVILVDLGLPDTEGIEAFLRVQARAPSTPVLVMTEHDDGALAVRALRAGAQDYLVKGQVTSRLLRRHLHNALERRQLLSDLERQKRTIELSRSRLWSMIHTTVDGMLILDRQGAVRFANPAAEMLLGVSADDLVGGPFGFPLSGDEPTELDIVRKDGEQLVAEMRLADIEWEGEEARLASLRDITAHKRMLAELDQTRQRQLEMKDQFLSHVSHELRSPLTSIYQFLTLVLDGAGGEINAQQRKYLQVVLEDVKQLKGMISDLLDVTRADTGKVTIRPRDVEVDRLVRDVAENFAAQAAEQGISLNTEIPEGLRPAYADRERVKQILGNLVDNAFKFTERGGSITIKAEPYAADQGLIRFSVVDTGVGIAAKDRSAIFERLHQAPNDIESSRKGLGLGLYICKELVVRQGGRIWVESESAKGSTFSFTLPEFSLERMLRAVAIDDGVVQPWLTLMTVTLRPADELSPEGAADASVQELWDLLGTCMIPQHDLVLPRISTPGQIENLYAVVRTDARGAVSVARRIRKRLMRASCISSGDVRMDVHVRGVVDPEAPERQQPLEQAVVSIAKKIEDVIDAAREERSGRND